jgi:hypothetical protein
MYKRAGWRIDPVGTIANWHSNMLLDRRLIAV